MEESILDIIQSIQELKKTVSDLKKGQSGHMIQSGAWEILDGWKNSNEISKEVSEHSDRELEETITFDKPFLKKPEIHVGLSHIDTDSANHHVRISVTTADITKEGFTLKIKTWVVSRIFGFKVEWLAYTY